MVQVGLLEEPMWSVRLWSVRKPRKRIFLFFKLSPDVMNTKSKQNGEPWKKSGKASCCCFFCFCFFFLCGGFDSFLMWSVQNLNRTVNLEKKSGNTVKALFLLWASCFVFDSLLKWSIQNLNRMVELEKLEPMFVKHYALNISLPLNMAKFVVCKNSTDFFGICPNFQR